VAASTARSTRLERLFSVDKAVRHGGLAKHSAYVGSPEKPKKIRLNKNLKKLRQRLGGNKAAGDQPDDGKISLSSKDLAHLNRSMDSENFLSQPDEKPESAVVITGKALGYIFGNVHLERMLFNIFSCQTSVIACRVSPKQKSLIVRARRPSPPPHPPAHPAFALAQVRLAKTNVYPRPVTLAIGDGANDVGMIQEAQIGIGISGLEGQQAVNAADFAIAQFRFLKELMLVHGRWNYIRMSKVCMYSFYKNAVLVLTMFFFQIYNHWCGRSQYEDYVVAMFNFFLGVPILAAGVSCFLGERSERESWSR
jgi:magnesium-transporting ATPase (P-type)